MNSNANSSTVASNTNSAAIVLIKDPKVLNAIKKLVEIRGRAWLTGDKSSLEKVLDDSYVDGGIVEGQTKMTKQELINRAKELLGFSSQEELVSGYRAENCELLANNGVNAKVSCFEKIKYNKNTVIVIDNVFYAVQRNGEWFLTGSAKSILYEGET